MPSPGYMIGAAIRLVIACLIVGGLLAVARIDPIELWQTMFSWVVDGVQEILGFGTEGLALILTLIAMGAVVVIPLWLVSKLLGSRRR